MKTSNRFNAACKKVAAWLFIIAFLVGLVPPFEIALFPRTLAAPVPVALAANEALVSSPGDLKTALENPSITTIYFNADISMRSWGLSGQDYANTSTSSNSYNNSTNMINVAARTGGQLTIIGTYNNNRYTYTDRRTSDQGSVPIRLPSTAMNITFKDINIYGYNYYGLLYGDNARHTIVFDNVFGVMPQFLHSDLATVVVRNSILKVRDTGLRIGQEFFESANVRLEGKNVFDHQPTDNCTMFWVKDGSNRSLTVANNAETTLIERGNNSYGILYPSGNSLILSDAGKLTSVVAEREGETAGRGDINSTTYTTGYNYGSSTRDARESNFTFSGSEAQASVTIGAGSELTIIHPFSSGNTSNDILRTTTSAGVTINEGGILSIYSNATNSRVLNTNNLILNNPRLVTLLTTANNNYLFNGTVPVKANKLKSIRYYNSPTGSNYDFTEFNSSYDKVVAPSNIASLTGFSVADGGYLTNRENPNTWFFQTTNSFDVTSANINGTGNISNSTYSGTTAVSGVATSITNTNFNASTMRVVQIDGDYSRRPTIDQAEAAQTSITGNGVPYAFVTLYDPSGKAIKTVDVGANGKWIVTGLSPLVAKQVYSATQQANIAGYPSSPSTQVTMTVNAKTFRLVASNNATKSSMTGYLNAAFNNVAGASDFKVENVWAIIFDDPDTVLPAETDFDTMYTSVANKTSSASYTGIAYRVEDGNIRPNAGVDDYMSVGREIDFNCKVWAKAEIKSNGTTFLYDTVSWKNIFTPYPVWARAVIAGSDPLDRLYIYEVVDPNRTYGLPYMGDGKTIYSKSPYVYDSVQLTAASLGLSYNSELVKHWHGYVGPGENWNSSNTSINPYPPTAYTLTLDGTFPTRGLYDGDDPSKYTLNYVKIPNTWENVTVRYVLADGTPISSVNGISSGSNDSKDKLSIPLEIGANSVPVDHTSANNSSTTFRELGGRYTPPSGGTENYSPIGWYVGTTPRTNGTYESQSDFGDATFNPIFSSGDQELYVVYSQSMYQVEEHFYRGTDTQGKPIEFDTPKVQYFEQVDDTTSKTYTIEPKKIGSSVPVGWEIWRGGVKRSEYVFSYDARAASDSSITPVSNQYEIFPEVIKSLYDLQTTPGDGTITIKYFYVQDDRNNGIPNTEEAALTIRWRGYTVDGSMWTVQPSQTVYGRASKTSLIPNNYASPSSVGKTGDPSHTIDNTVVPNAPNAKWMFDEISNNAQKEGMFGGAGDAGIVNFDYAFSTKGNNKKDKDQYVDELYHFIDSDDAEKDFSSPTSLPPTKTYILEGGSYSKVPLSVPGYIYVGYRWSDGYSATYTSIYQNGMSPPPITLSPTGQRQTVTSIYRKEATGSVTVNWTGKTYAGGTITFNTVRKTGYVGEVVPIYPNDAVVSSSWTYEGGYSSTAPTSTSLVDPLVFRLGDGVQTGHFQFNESFDEVIITARYVSDDGSIDFTQTFPKTLATSTDSVVVNPFTLSGYDLTDWIVKDSYGNTMQSSATASISSLNDPVTIPPSKGTQTITFNYKSNITSLYIRCYDETGQEIPGQAEYVNNVKVGDIFYRKAPVVETSDGKYALLDSEPLVKSINITSGANLITFRYQKITDLKYIILKEISTSAAGSKDEIIGYRVFSTASSLNIPAPDLSEYYYSRYEGDKNNPDQKTYTGTALTFLYTKDMLDVKIIPVNSTGTSISVYEDRLNDVARAGEMYEAICNIKIPGYTLTDTVSKKVYATSTSLNDPIIVPFTFKKDELGDVSVVYYYGSDSNKDNKNYQLGSYTLKAVVGSKLTVTEQEFEGFTCSTPSSLWQEITVTTAKQTIYFQYIDKRKTVNVQYFIKSGNNWTSLPAPTGAVTEIKVVSDQDCVIDVPYIKLNDGKNYLLNGYATVSSISGSTSPGSSIHTVPLGTTQILLNDVDSDITVFLCYDDSDTSILEQFVTVTVRGVSGSTVLYEYSVNRLKESGAYAVNAQKVFGYKLTTPTVTTKTVTITSLTPAPVVFDYTSLSMDVTIRARDTGGATITSFSDIHVSATEGQPFSYNAPYIPGWNLSGAATQTISSLSASNNVLTFNYTQASGNVTVLLKEDDKNGRIIQTISATANVVGEEIPIPSLDTYTKVSLVPATISSLDSGQIVEYYYEKIMRQVEIERHKLGDSRIDIASAGSYRVGEVASFTAPAPPANYRLFGSAQQMVIVEAGGGSKIVTFEYEDITTITDELVINAVDNGKLLYTYTLTGSEGQSVSIPAPYVPGYVLENTQSAVQTGTFGSTDKSLNFEYRKNVSTVTVMLRLQNGADITYLAPAGFLTSFETEMGKNCTVVAPNLDGYVLAAGQSPQTTLSALQTASDQTVTFYYRLVEDLFVTHTIVGMDSTNTALYTYNFSVKQGSGTTAYTPATIHNYTCTTTNSTSTLPNSSDGVIVFRYALATTTITVNARAKGSTTSLPGFPIYYYDGEIGKSYSVRAPYIANYVLATSTSLYQTITSLSASNTLLFEYEALDPGSVYLELRETGGNIIELIKVDKSYDLADLQALLSSDFYTYDSSTQPSASFLPINPTTTPNGRYPVYYTKNDRPILVKAVEKGNTTNILATYTSIGRVGEMYKAVAPSIKGYSLVASPTQMVFVEDDSIDPIDPIEVIFQYTKSTSGDVEVKAFYTSGTSLKKILFEYVLTGTVGATVDINVPEELVGWRLKDPQTNYKEHTFIENASPTSYEFEYVMQEVSVTIKAIDAATGQPISIAGYTVTKLVQADVPISIEPPPAPDGYTLLGADGPYINRVFAASVASVTLTFKYQRLSTDGTIVLIYKDTDGKQLGTRTRTAAIGSVTSIVSGTAPPFDATNYTLESIKKGNGTLITSGFNAVTAIFGTDLEVVLIYKYTGISFPKIDHGTVTSLPQNPTAGQQVTGTITPEDGYELATLLITSGTSTSIPYTFVPNTVPPTPNADGTYTFTYTQPEGGVTITPTFRAKGSGTSPVTVNPTDNGGVTVNPQNPASGTSVIITLTPNPGYKLKSVTVTDKAGHPVTVTLVSPSSTIGSEGVYTATYTQPNGGAIVNAEYEKIGGTGTTPSVIVDDTDNGSVTISPQTPGVGDTVTVTITPSTGYDFDPTTFTIKDGNQNSVTNYSISYNNGTYTVKYIQPPTGATVHAEFVPSVLILTAKNGKLTVDNYTPLPDTKVTITALPDVNYRANTVTVMDCKNQTVTSLTKNADGTWSYTQPQGGATVIGTFVSTGSAKASVTSIPDHGDVVINPNPPKPGEAVTVIITPDTNYTVKDVTIKDSTGKSLPYTLRYIGNGKYEAVYIQPDGEASINVSYAKSVVITNPSNGVITTNTEDPDPGEVVKVTVTPNSGFTPDNVTVTDKNGNTSYVTLTPNGDGTWSGTYTQPEGGVTIGGTLSSKVSVSVTTTGSGVVIINPVQPVVGQPVYVVTIPGYGYALADEPTIRTTSGDPVEDFEDLGDGLFSYKQPNSNVIVTANFIKSSIKLDVANGQVIMQPANPKPGQMVTLTFEPSYGYKYDHAPVITKGDGITPADIEEVQQGMTRSTSTYQFTWGWDSPDIIIKMAFSQDPLFNSSRVVINQTGNGIVSIDKLYPNPGETVTITAMPAPGFAFFGGISVRNIDSTSSTPTSVTNIGGGKYTYVQPDTGIAQITVTFTPGAPNIDVVIAPPGNGVVDLLVDKYVKPGDEVKISVAPVKGFTLDSIAILDRANVEVAGVVLVPDPDSNRKGASIGTYIQPDPESIIKAIFTESVKVNVVGGNGSVIRDIQYPYPGDEVTLTIKPYTGYTLGRLKVMDEMVFALINTNGEYIYSFTQPRTGGVDIEVEFIQLSSFGANGPADQAYKDAAKDEIEKRYQRLITLNGSKYTSQQLSDLKQARDNALTAIDNALTVGYVDAAKNYGIDAMNAVPVGTGGSSGGGGGGAASSGTTGSTVSPTEHGRLIIDNINAKEGETVTLYPLPEHGYELDKLEIKDSNGKDVAYTKNADGTYSFVQPKGKVTINTIFKPMAIAPDPSDVSAILNTVDHMAYVSGRGNGAFAPTSPLTRAEAAQLFFELLVNRNVPINKSFPDVPADAWFAKAVNSLASLGIITGLPDGNYNPNSHVTRAEFVAIAVKFAAVAPCDVRFSDVPKTHWSYVHISTAVNLGWISADVGIWGFAPDRPITRAEMVSIINKVLKRTPDKAYIDSHSSLAHFTDVGTDHWAYYDIMEAANAHNYTKDDRKETWK